MFFPPKQSQHLKTKSFVHLGNFLDLKQIFNKCFQMSVFFFCYSGNLYSVALLEILERPSSLLKDFTSSIIK